MHRTVVPYFCLYAYEVQNRAIISGVLNGNDPPGLSSSCMTYISFSYILENEMRRIMEKMKDCRTPSFTAYCLFNITGGIRMTNRPSVTKHSFALSLITTGHARWPCVLRCGTMTRPINFIPTILLKIIVTKAIHCQGATSRYVLWLLS